MNPITDFHIIRTTLTQYLGNDEIVTVPESVTRISKTAFRNSEVKSVFLPNHLLFLDNSSFENCENLMTVNIPEKLKTIPLNCFKKCKELYRIFLPDSITSLEPYAFRSCIALKEVVLSEKLVSIEEGVFRDTKSLKTIKLPSSIKEIKEYAFIGSGIEDIVIPEGVKRIGGHAFSLCNHIKSFKVNNPKLLISKDWFIPFDNHFCIEREICFQNVIRCNLPINFTFDTLIDIKDFIYKILILDDDDPSLTEEWKREWSKYLVSRRHSYIDSFLTNDKLFNLLLNNKGLSLEEVESLIIKANENGLIDKTALLLEYKNNTFSFDEISNYTFSSFDLMDEEEVKENNEKWEYIQKRDQSLILCLYKGDEKNIVIPQKIGKNIVSELSQDLFNSENNTLKDYEIDIRRRINCITIPDTITRIGKRCFKALNIKSIKLPDSIKIIEEEAFNECYDLEEINIPSSITEIEDRTFRKTAIKNITLPSQLTKIGDYAFDSCFSLTDLVIPKKVSDIGKGAFTYCSSLTDINIPENVTQIKSHTFDGCASLTNISLPNTIEKIDKDAFSRCDKLNELHLPKNITDLSPLFLGESSKTEIIIPPNSLRYETRNGVIRDRKEKSIIYASKSIKGNIVVSEGYKEIREKAFKHCKDLESIILPDSLEKIGRECFDSCFLLRNVAIGENVKEMGEKAFCNCTKLETCGLSKNIKRINKQTFCNCTSLKFILIPEGVKEIGEEAFNNCTSLEKIELPKGIETLEYNCFGGCKLLENINVPETVKDIDDHIIDALYKDLNIECSDNSLGNLYFHYLTEHKEDFIPPKD